LADYLENRLKTFSQPEVHQALNKKDYQIIEAGINIHFCEIETRKQEAELRTAILFVIAMLGIKNEPDKTTVNFILAFMRNHFPHLTLAEFKVAFEINLLNQDENKPQHFHSFNLEFITPVLKNFLFEKQQALANMNKVIIPKERQLSEHQSTDKDYYDRLISYIEEKKQLPSFWNWIAVFNHMEYSGKVTETDEEIKSFKEKVKQEVKTQAQLDKLKAADRIERRRIDELLNPHKMNDLYKKEYVKMKLKILKR
jgi:hypothetical protein